MPLSAQLASLSDPVFISDNFFGFCEAAWSCLAVGGAHSEPVTRTGLGVGRSDIKKKKPKIFKEKL